MLDMRFGCGLRRNRIPRDDRLGDPAVIDAARGLYLRRRILGVNDMHADGRKEPL